MAIGFKRVPLRIPSGWAVTFNIFWEMDPLMEGGKFVNANDFTQDLLVLERIVPQGSGWPAYILDLGWYPDGDAHGSYRLVLKDRDADGTLKTFESRDRDEIREKLDAWLDVLSRLDFEAAALSQF
jgi:hypothetical protein